MTDVRHEVFETNSIIRASAGTGKTYALATRFIRLMLVDGVRPETIVALTFSRAAAQEIYTKILDRLCKAASDGVDEKTGQTLAEREWNALLEDYRNGQIRHGAEKLAAILANPPAHSKDDFARLLRNLVDTQHLGAIATIDSFILKIVRNFPKEMGVQNAVSVLDPNDENSAIDDAVKRALSRTDGSGTGIANAFVKAQKGEYSRECLSAIGRILAGQGWRNFVLAHPECLDREHGGRKRWTVASMAAKLGVDLNSVCPDLSMIPFNEIKRKNTKSPEETFVAFVRSYDDTACPLDVSGAAIPLMQFFWENPEATSYDYHYYGHDYTLNCGREGAAAIHGAIRHMMNVYLKRQLEIVEAKISLVDAVESEYERMTRRMGKLTFADFTAYSAEEEFSQRGIALKNVEFRFDSKFDHWALDEFQDTSELQWRCLKELVKSAAEDGCEGGDRTAMAVGDMKQSIYTWRGASARPFDDIASWEAFKGFERDFSESHRYGPHIANFVNLVFGLSNIKVGDLIRPVCADAVAAWRQGWRDHVSHENADYVKVVNGGEDVLDALYEAIEPFWRRHCDAKSTDTVGILVRSNDNGLKVAEYLRAHGIREVVWEGKSPCGDDPVVQAVLALLKLAEHPSDTAAWQTVSELLDIRSILLPGCTTLASVSEGVARLLVQQGLSRTLKDWRAKLSASGRISPTGLTNDKLRRLVELAVAFEGRTTGDGGMLEFADFVANSGDREIAVSPDVIRILTIHRSKGLGIDHVFVPLFESKKSKSPIDVPKSSAPLFDGGEWVLSHLEKGSEQFNPLTKAAYDKMCGERFAESLRTYYVALTRAKKSMVVLLADDSKGETSKNGLLMRDLIRAAVGGVLPYEAGALPPLEPKLPKRGGAAGGTHPAWPLGEKCAPVRCVTPSHGAVRASNGRSAADLFDAGFGDAVQKGMAAHSDYAAIEWIDPVAPRNELERHILANDFRAAFVKPSPVATVWRERRYELYRPQARTSGSEPNATTWESGQFDRVVFTGDGENRSAVVYDFKTNARHRDESDAEFAARMVSLYGSQLLAYRRAIHALTKIPFERIASKLLLTASGLSLSC